MKIILNGRKSCFVFLPIKTKQESKSMQHFNPLLLYICHVFNPMIIKLRFIAYCSLLTMRKKENKTKTIRKKIFALHLNAIVCTSAFAYHRLRTQSFLVIRQNCCSFLMRARGFTDWVGACTSKVTCPLIMIRLYNDYCIHIVSQSASK